MTTIILLVTSFVVIYLFNYFKKYNCYDLLIIINNNLKNYRPNQEFFPTNEKWCEELRDNYKVIRDEYLEYTKNYKLKRLNEIDDFQSYIDEGDIPWEILLLRVYNKNTEKIKFFPKTMELMDIIPGCCTIMFSVLKSGKKVPAHAGPYDGVIRYHLSLIIPEDNENCFLVVNNTKHIWQEGEDVMFDDNFLHLVENNSKSTRVILFLDIQRKYNNLFIDWFNTILLRFIQYNDTVGKMVNNTNI